MVSGSIARKLKLIFLVLAVCFAFSINLNSKVAAQVITGSGWSEPLNLSNTLSGSSEPIIIADTYGQVHVFWSEDLDGSPHLLGTAPNIGNAILYRRNYLGEWSEPIDIFYAGENGRAGPVSAAFDGEGYLNLLWLQDSNLYFSRALAWNAAQVQTWSKPLIVDQGRIPDLELLSINDQFLALYSLTSGDVSGLVATSIIRGEPAERAIIWANSANSAAQFISAAIDGRGWIHVVWDTNIPPDPAGKEVWYASSEDAGRSWQNIRLVARESSEDDGLTFARPWVAARGESEIHLQWAQGLHTYRWHQYSLDGGSSWSQPAQIWSDFVSQSNSQAVGVDGDGTLFWADQFRFPMGAYLTRWENNRWVEPELFYLMQANHLDPLGDRINVHKLRLAIAGGNRLHVIFQDQDRAEIWYMEKSLDAEPIPTLSPPKIELTDEQKPDPRVTAQSGTLQPNLDSEPVAVNTGSRISQDNPGITILAGIFPALFVISFILFLKTRRK